MLVTRQRGLILEHCILGVSRSWKTMRVSARANRFQDTIHTTPMTILTAIPTVMAMVIVVIVVATNITITAMDTAR